MDAFIKVFQREEMFQNMKKTPLNNRVIYCTPAKRMFSGVYWNQPFCLSLCPSIHVAVCIQNTSFFQRDGWGINPFPNKTLVFTCLHCESFENTVGKREIAHNEQFLLFPQCFLPIWRTFIQFYQS